LTLEFSESSYMMQFMSSSGITFSNSDGKRLSLQIYPGKKILSPWIN